MNLTTTVTPAAVQLKLQHLNLLALPEDQAYVQAILDTPITQETFSLITGSGIGKIGVTDTFKEIVDYFAPFKGKTPAGFRRVVEIESNQVVVDLVRDISCGIDGADRPTKLLYSADSANPYEVAQVAPFLSNLTCNPGIIYDLFLNNPEANIGGAFKNRDEVITELGNVLGPGCDISVELNNPFETDFAKILDEAARFKEILSPWRVVIKVPHTGPVNGRNVNQLLQGNEKLDLRYSAGTTEDRLRGHNLALKLNEAGYRVNFTLMFEPYQTAMALQARPYFINSFVRHRQNQTTRIRGLVGAWKATEDPYFLSQLRTYLQDTDYLSSAEGDLGLLSILQLAEAILHQRSPASATEPDDGLDAARHSLRVLRNANLPDTRLIICSMEGDLNYPDIDRLLAEPEFEDMVDRVILTAEPQYLARFTSSNQVVSYQRRFMKAAAGQS